MRININGTITCFQALWWLLLQFVAPLQDYHAKFMRQILMIRYCWFSGIKMHHLHLFTGKLYFKNTFFKKYLILNFFYIKTIINFIIFTLFIFFCYRISRFILNLNIYIVHLTIRFYYCIFRTFSI